MSTFIRYLRAHRGSAEPTRVSPSIGAAAGRPRRSSPTPCRSIPSTAGSGPLGWDQDPYVVELETDEGYTGFAANYGGGQYACDVIDTHYRRFIEGANPFDVERIWEQMYRAQLPYGQRGISMMAISGVDLALYDLVGKITGQPVYNLFGGKSKDEIPCYVTTHMDIMEHMVGEGFFGVKLAAPWGPADGKEGLRKTEEMVAETVETFGEDMDVMIDAYMAWDKEFTVRAAERLRPCSVRFGRTSLSR